MFHFPCCVHCKADGLCLPLPILPAASSILPIWTAHISSNSRAGTLNQLSILSRCVLRCRANPLGFGAQAVLGHCKPFRAALTCSLSRSLIPNPSRDRGGTPALVRGSDAIASRHCCILKHILELEWITASAWAEGFPGSCSPPHPEELYCLSSPG